MTFEMAQKTLLAPYINQKIILIDNLAEGYAPNKVAGLIRHLIDNTNSKAVDWSEKEKLKEYV